MRFAALLIINIFFLFQASIKFAKAQGVFKIDAEGKQWVDSVFSTLSLEQKVGQIFMVSGYSNRTMQHQKDILNLIKNYHLGGICFFQGGPLRQASLTNIYQAESKIPLLISMDAEWGLDMRLDSTLRFPRQMTLGATMSIKDVERMGAEMAAQLKRLGVHISFSPDADVNSNAANPVIGVRSFGSNRDHVSIMAAAYMRGLQNNGIIADAKHFPGHGDAAIDSHFGLPIINRSYKALDSVEIYPFKKLIAAGIQSIMIAHLQVPALDSAKNSVTSLSRAVVTDLLRRKMGFNGLIFTDGLNMRGATTFTKPGELEVAAFKAGNDILLCSEVMPKAFELIVKGIKDSTLSASQLDSSVIRILTAKYFAGLNKPKRIEIVGLSRYLNLPSTDQFISYLYQNAVTLTRNIDGVLPIANLEKQPFVSVSLGAELGNRVEKSLGQYASFTNYALPSKALATDYDSVVARVGSGKTVIISVQGIISKPAQNFGIADSALALPRRLQSAGNTVVVLTFGNSYSLKYFSAMPTSVCFYEDNKYTNALAGQIVFGAIAPSGKLPISADVILKNETGSTFGTLGRLKYDRPDAVMIDSTALGKMDSIMLKAIADQDTPGAQILVARNGTVIYNKSFGTLEGNAPQFGTPLGNAQGVAVTNATLYDVASVTKIAATLQVLMHGVSEKKIKLDGLLSDYVLAYKNSNKANVTVASLLHHQAGLQPYIPFYKRTINTNGPNGTIQYLTKWYRYSKQVGFSNQVADNLYVTDAISDSVTVWIAKSELLPKNASGKYDTKYSDISFMLLQQITERVYGNSLDSLAQVLFYKPLGMYHTTFRPLSKFNINSIAPTEIDSAYRSSTLQGTVHDQQAALLGGVSGHAGLFSTASDLAILMQMQMQYGRYGGKRYLDSAVVAQFISRETNDTRALGYDLQQNPWRGGSISRFASLKTFGHTGFTGTCIWSDPVYDLTFIFLSNRVYPTRNNMGLLKNNIRSKLHDVVYQAIKMPGAGPTFLVK